jgi:molecular chaperone GrpE (heat shock protein)
MIVTINGKNYCIFTKDDCMEIIDEKLGLEFRRTFEELENPVELQDYEDTIRDLEMEIDSYRMALLEIQSEVNNMLLREYGTSKRVTKDKVISFLKSVLNLIDNEL